MLEPDRSVRIFTAAADRCGCPWYFVSGLVVNPTNSCSCTKLCLQAGMWCCRAYHLYLHVQQQAIASAAVLPCVHYIAIAVVLTYSSRCWCWVQLCLHSSVVLA